MLFNAKFMTLASLFVVVVSQTPPPQCVLDCSQAALSSATNTSCKSFADPCVCMDKGFQTADGACLKANCTTADQAAAAQLAQTVCGISNTTTASGASTSGTDLTMSGSMTMSANMTSMTATPSSSNSGSSTGSSSGSAASASKSSGAGPQAEFGLFALGVAAAGAVVGGLII